MAAAGKVKKGSLHKSPFYKLYICRQLALIVCITKTGVDFTRAHSYNKGSRN